MPTRKAPYPAEFRQQMAELVHVGRTPSQLCARSTSRHRAFRGGWRKLPASHGTGVTSRRSTARKLNGRLICSRTSFALAGIGVPGP